MSHMKRLKIIIEGISEEDKAEITAEEFDRLFDEGKIHFEFEESGCKNTGNL